MLPLSNFTITLGKSNNYLRLACLIHVFALVVVWNSSLPISIMLSMLLVLIGSFISIARNRVPVPSYDKLSYHINHWLLHDIHGQAYKYEQAQLSFDAGLFFLLSLISETSTKKLIIFTDQLTTAQHRALNVIGKLTSSPP